jgi:hypothetical protein
MVLEGSRTARNPGGVPGNPKVGRGPLNNQTNPHLSSTG